MTKKNKTIRKLTTRNILFNKKRNAVITTAVIFTVFMFTAVLSVGLGIINTAERHALRTNGAVEHIRLTDPTAEQLRQINDMEQSKSIGLRFDVGNIIYERAVNINIVMAYIEETVIGDIFSPAWSDITGQYPQALNEIMASRELLENLGIYEPQIGMSVRLTYTTIGGLAESEFMLSGLYTNYDWLRGGSERVLLVSDEFARANNAENPDMIYFIFEGEHAYLFTGGITLADEQGITASVGTSRETEILILTGIIVFLILVASYLLIFNILNISVSQDVRFYGLLKVIGASAGQIRKVVYGQIFILAVIGIPIGLMLGVIAPFLIVPMFAGEAVAVISFSPLIYLGGVGLAITAIITGASSPAQKAEKISPVEAVKYAGDINIKIKARFPTRGKPLRMALRNISRDRKRAVLMLLSLSLSILIFTAVSIGVNSMDMTLYVETMEVTVDNDFSLYFKTGYSRDDYILSNELMGSIRNLPGVINVHPTISAYGYLTYQPVLDAQIDRITEAHNAAVRNGAVINAQIQTKDEVIDGLRCSFIGIDVEMLEVFEDIPWDIDAWERGEFAVVISDFPENFDGLHYIDGVMILFNEEIWANIEGRRHTRNDFPFAFHIPVGGAMPYHKFEDLVTNPHGNDITGVELIISNNYLAEFLSSYGFDPPPARLLNIASDSDYDESLLKTLTAIVENLSNDNRIIMLHSKARGRLAVADTQKLLTMIGTCISIILGLAGVQNFISSVSASLIMRKKEFAVLESVGMSRLQLLFMLIYEGIFYAVTTLAIGIGIGTAAFALIYQQANGLRERLLIFSYPAIPIISMVLFILLICISISIIMCLIVQRDSVVDRLKEAGV